MEERILHTIHASLASGPLDSLFWFSNLLGTHRFCVALVIVMAAFWAIRRDPHEAVLWIVLGINVYLLQKGLKLSFERVRPDLWTGPVPAPSSFAFPSGHAVAAATFYPLLGRALARRYPDRRVLAYGAGIAMAFYVGFGRLYLGVHWPTDVLAGWAIGGAQTFTGIWVLERLKRQRPQLSS